MARADLVRTEVPFRKSAAGPGLQVVLEADRTLLVGELQRDHDTPGSISNGVSAGTGVVPVQPLLNVAGYADVMALGIALAAQNVRRTASRRRASLHGVARFAPAEFVANLSAM